MTSFDFSGETTRARNAEWARRIAAGERAGTIAREFGVSRQRVHHVIHRDHHRAHRRVRRAIQSGQLVRPEACPRCSRTDLPIEAHHADYSRPLDVEWCCRACHLGEHFGNTQARNARIRELHAEGVGYRRLAAQFGISRTMARVIALGTCTGMAVTDGTSEES
jgi:hypothetical protein